MFFVICWSLTVTLNAFLNSRVSLLYSVMYVFTFMPLIQLRCPLIWYSYYHHTLKHSRFPPEIMTYTWVFSQLGKEKTQNTFFVFHKTRFCVVETSEKPFQLIHLKNSFFFQHTFDSNLWLNLFLDILALRKTVYLCLWAEEWLQTISDHLASSLKCPPLLSVGEEGRKSNLVLQFSAPIAFLCDRRYRLRVLFVGLCEDTTDSALLLPSYPPEPLLFLLCQPLWGPGVKVVMALPQSTCVFPPGRKLLPRFWWESLGCWICTNWLPELQAIELFGLERTFKIISFQILCHGQE